MEWFNRIVEFLNAASPARAIALSMLGGMALTQWIKFEFADSNHYRVLTRAWSTCMTTALCMMLDPATGSIAADSAVAVIAGLSSPTLYWGVVKTLYHFFPWMEQKLSASPVRKEDSP